MGAADPFRRATSEPAESRSAADPYRRPEEYAPADPYWPADPYGPEAYRPDDPYSVADPYGSAEYDPADPYGPADPLGPADPYEPETYGPPGSDPFSGPVAYRQAEAYGIRSARPEHRPRPAGRKLPASPKWRHGRVPGPQRQRRRSPASPQTQRAA